jgi:cytochrome P450
MSYDWWDKGVQSNPYPTYARMHEKDPVRWEEAHEAWHVVKHEHVLAALRDEETLRARVDRRDFLTRWPEALEEARLVRRFFDSWLLFSDAPDHTRIRSIVQHLYSRSAARRLAPVVAEASDRLLEPLADRDRFDLLNEYALPLARSALAALLGIPDEELARATHWSDEISTYMSTEVTGETLQRVAPSIREFTDWSVAICARPDLPEGSLGFVLGAALREGTIDENELAATVAQNVTGSLAALAQFVTHSMLRLIERPEQLARLRADPARIGPAIEELLRFECPFLLIVRETARDLPLDGTTIPANNHVALFIGASNRDPAVFAEPDRLDLDRRAAHHMAFGFGAHYCLGAAVSREVSRIALLALLDTFPVLDLPEGEILRMPSIGIRWLKALQISTSVEDE